MHSPNERGHGHDVGCHIWPIYILELKMSFYFFQIFCKALDGAFNATKIVQIDEGLNKICILQVKGVMGMWVGIYDQFAF